MALNLLLAQGLGFMDFVDVLGVVTSCLELFCANPALSLLAFVLALVMEDVIMGNIYSSGEVSGGADQTRRRARQ